MVIIYIIGTFIAVMILSWIFGLMGINISEGPNAGMFYFYGSIIIGILLDINSKLSKKGK